MQRMWTNPYKSFPTNPASSTAAAPSRSAKSLHASQCDHSIHCGWFYKATEHSINMNTSTTDFTVKPGFIFEAFRETYYKSRKPAASTNPFVCAVPVLQRPERRQKSWRETRQPRTGLDTSSALGSPLPKSGSRDEEGGESPRGGRWTAQWGRTTSDEEHIRKSNVLCDVEHLCYTIKWLKSLILLI